MTGPATAKFLIPSVVVVLGTGRNPRTEGCLLPAIAEIARQSSVKYHTAILKRLWCHAEICISDTSKLNNVSIRQAISTLEAHCSHACAACDNSVIRYVRISACIVIVSCRVRFVANSPAGCCTITVCNCCPTIELRHHQHYTVQTVSVIMTAAHVATLCPVCLRQTTRSLRERL